jgi:hypothetical protein
MSFRHCSVTLFAFLLTVPLYAQFTDSLKITIGTTGTVAGKNYQPLWLVANRFGTITDQQADLSTHFRFTNLHLIGSSHKTDTTRDNKSNYKGASVSYGFDLYNHNHFRTVFVEQGYVKLNYKNWEIRGGRYEEVIGEVDQQLSSGSLGISGNSLPIPKIGIAVTDYTNVPFTKGWVQFKGRYSHGWLGKEQYIKNAYLHEKSFYLQLGKGKLRFSGGLTHFAEWGGVHPQGPAPRRFKDYLRIIVGAGGNGADPVYQQGPVDIANAVGNHIIIPDFGISYRASSGIFKVYTQNIFEKGKGRGAYERDRLVGLKILGKDRLAGFSWENKQGQLLQKIVVEGIYTRYQGGPVIFEGKDNYYNNATYNTGWEYQKHIIGTPLFINQSRATHYNLNRAELDNWNIVSNRIAGAHLGLKGKVTEHFGYRTLATYVRHYGNYYNDQAFSPAPAQLHLLQEVTYRIGSLSVTGAFGLDSGDLSRNAGGSLRIEWVLK